MDNNKQVYSTDKAVKEYACHEALENGEASIFKRYHDKISGTTLDIGIGAGRTTRYLAPISGNYTGVDFSLPFVKYCAEKYKAMPNVTIQYGDARELNDFNDHSFDFILFSYNGIDYVDMEGRGKILAELSRLIKPDGVVCFSFHNKGNLDKLYSFQYPRNPFKYLWEWNRRKKVRALNGDKEKYKSKDWFIIKDGGENFTADTFYIDPIFQQKLLGNVGFKTFSFYDTLTGMVISPDNLAKTITPWIYVVAIK